jgi:methyltransferase (TIGR00027 family)
MAYVRARESARPDRLFDDPLAAAFVAATPDTFEERLEPGDGQRAGVGAAFAMHAIIRTRYYDEYLVASGLRQVVLLAAGLDTRAFRLPWPDGSHLFEVDLPEVLAFKQNVLDARAVTPKCLRTTVAVDLRDDWAAALVAAGFDTTRPTAWLVEGILIYLDHDAADRLLTGVDTMSAPGSQVAFEASSNATSDIQAQAEATPSLREYSSLWRGGLSGDPADWLRAHGWTPTVDGLADLAQRYGRPLRTTAASSLLTAVRRGQ